MEKQFRIVDGRRLQWWQCTDCGRDLGPAAAQFRMQRTFPYPCAYRGHDGRTLCGQCYNHEHGVTPVLRTVEAAQC
jgi:hypothetical protein